MGRTIKELEDKLSSAAEKYEEFEREVSLFDTQHSFSLHMLTSLCPEFQISVWRNYNKLKSEGTNSGF